MSTATFYETEIANYRMREQIAKDANDKMRADLAARDALCGELRDALTPLLAARPDGDIGWRGNLSAICGWITVKHILAIEAAIDKTPESCGAELARLRDLSERAVKQAEVACDERDTLREQLAEKTKETYELQCRIESLEDSLHNAMDRD